MTEPQPKHETSQSLEAEIEDTVAHLVTKIRQEDEINEPTFLGEIKRKADTLIESPILKVTEELIEQLRPSPTEMAITNAFRATIAEQQAQELTQLALEQQQTPEQAKSQPSKEMYQAQQASVASAEAWRDYYSEAAQSKNPVTYLLEGQKAIEKLRSLSEQEVELPNVLEKFTQRIQAK